MPESVILGNDVETGHPLRIGDIERRSGLYALGKPGMGKSALLVNIMNQDIDHGHGLRHPLSCQITPRMPVNRA